MLRNLVLVAISAMLVVVVFLIPGKAQEKRSDSMNLKPLSPQEERVIVHKGTEAPFSGEYVNHKADGTYTCKRCGAALFDSDTKFDSHCGWPSFDDAIPGAVKEQPDPDGSRTEIVCAACGAHLGHVFRGEGFTDKNTRHCVNSISLDFKAEGSKNATDAQKDEGTAYFAGGCFWGVEYHLENQPGVLSAVSGYMGGSKENPTYEQVCYSDTGHAETVKVTYDPAKTDFETLARLFFEIHDPTQKDRQGPDRGKQYRSAIFYTNESQHETIMALIAELEKRGFDVKTEVTPATTFWSAEEYHQNYYEKTGKSPYCHSRVERFGK